jgi:protein-tyrosine phosphatase
MDNSSYFIKNRSLFGSFPSQESVQELEEHGVRYFVDLTDITKEKKISEYKTKYTYINYPIDDHSIPTDIISFSTFIINISNIIKNLKEEERLYLHCKGG